jgi:ribonuclease HI
MKSVLIYTDGACRGNPGPGGWAAVLIYRKQRKEISGGSPATTNNRMELQAAIQGLGALKEPCSIEFFTDSEYLRNGIMNYVRTWKRNGWQTKDKAPVKNKDQWLDLDRLTQVHQIAWRWLKGHAGHKENERCDSLARAEVDKVVKLYTARQLGTLLQEFKNGSNVQQVLNTSSLFQRNP